MSQDPTVSVHPDRVLRTVPAGMLGINDIIWDAHLGDPEVVDLLRDAGVGLRAFNGGPLTDLYHWRDHTRGPDEHLDSTLGEQFQPMPGAEFETFAEASRRGGAQMLVHVNYGTGTPEEAADWVRHANVVHGYDVRYWELGEEVHRNGYYPDRPDRYVRQPDHHTDRSPSGFVKHAREFIAAMKAVDPSIRVGVPFLAPGEIQIPEDREDWNVVLLTELAPLIDFVDLHWYPLAGQKLSDAEVLAHVRGVPAAAKAVREQLLVHAGAHADRIEIIIGGANSAGVQFAEQQIGVVNALYLADNALTWLEHGASVFAWWATRNGGMTMFSEPGHFGDLGVLATGERWETAAEPPLNTPFAPYFGLCMVGRLTVPGNQLLATDSTDPDIAAHAARTPSGALVVLLANLTTEDRRVELAGPGFDSGADRARYTGGPAIEWDRVDAARAHALPPHSLTLLVLDEREADA